MTDFALSQLRNRYLGFIFQTFNLIPVLNAFENVEYPLWILETNKAERKDRVEKMLSQVGLEKYMNHRPDELSGGQRQRVAIARALVTRPKLVLADEPTANLDHNTGESILQIMHQMNEEFACTFIFSTHDPEVVNHAKKVYRVRDGKIVFEDKK